MSEKAKIQDSRVDKAIEAISSEKSQIYRRLRENIVFYIIFYAAGSVKENDLELYENRLIEY